MLVSRRKRYLSGSDWVIATFDRLMKEVTTSGHMSQIVLMLEPPVEETRLRDHLNRFARRFPVLKGRIARDFKLTPYWKIPVAGDDVSLTVTRVADASSPEVLLPLLRQNANSRFRDDREHLAFHLISDRETSVLAMTFDHRLLDARGAESLLDLIRQSVDRELPSGDIDFVSSMELTRWKSKFLAGRNVNRKIIAMSGSAPRALPFPRGRDRGYTFRMISFSGEETAAIYDRAYGEAGYLMESPFFLAVVTETMHDLFDPALGAGMSYLVPVTVDLRPGKDPVQEIFFNHASYLFYQIPSGSGGDRRGLLATIKQQMFDQVKSGFPANLAEASLLMRIVPLRLLGRLLHLPMEGKMATFVFSHLGRSYVQAEDFLGSAITALFHMPRVPAPPGLGFFSTLYRGRLTMVISCLDGLLADEDLDRLEAGIRSRFTGDGG